MPIGQDFILVVNVYQSIYEHILPIDSNLAHIHITFIIDTLLIGTSWT